MAGNQFAFNYYPPSHEIEGLFDTSKSRLDQYFEHYKLTKYQIRYI